MTLAFLALFGLFAAAVLRFASVTEAQRTSTERAASIDGVAQGAAQFAVADTGLQGCGTVSGGTLMFASGDVLSYNLPSASSCGVSSAGVPPGHDRELCLLGFGTSPDADDTVLSTDNAVVVNGEIDGNGRIIGSGAVSAVGPAARIGLLNPACAQACLPSPVTLSAPFADPLGTVLPTPPEDWNTTRLPANSGDATTPSPGFYKGINATNGTVTLSAGTYVVTGSINVSDIGVLTSNGEVKIYLTCPTLTGSGPNQHWACNSGEAGGTFNVSGNGSFALTAPASGTYAGISLFSDANLSDPSDGNAARCRGSGGTFSRRSTSPGNGNHLRQRPGQHRAERQGPDDRRQAGYRQRRHRSPKPHRDGDSQLLLLHGRPRRHPRQWCQHAGSGALRSQLQYGAADRSSTSPTEAMSVASSASAPHRSVRLYLCDAFGLIACGPTQRRNVGARDNGRPVQPRSAAAPRRRGRVHPHRVAGRHRRAAILAGIVIFNVTGVANRGRQRRATPISRPSRQRSIQWSATTADSWGFSTPTAAAT